jgi:hypothetical protein
VQGDAGQADQTGPAGKITPVDHDQRDQCRAQHAEREQQREPRTGTARTLLVDLELVQVSGRGILQALPHAQWTGRPELGEPGQADHHVVERAGQDQAAHCPHPV